MRVKLPAFAPRTKVWVRYCCLLVALICALVGAPFINQITPARASTLPSGFVESLLTSGLTAPTNMEFAPDGRLFVLQKAGQVMIIKNGVLLSTPFATVPAATTVDLGLM